jgi:hypothetical protein
LIPFLLQQLGETFRFFDRRGADQHGLIAVVKSLDLIRGGEVFFFFSAVNDVGILNAKQRAVGRNDDDFQPVNLVELWRFGFRCAGHARQLLVHAEIILKRDRGERLVLALDLDVFLGFDGLV